jgi:hypothetical protein
VKILDVTEIQPMLEDTINKIRRKKITKKDKEIQILDHFNSELISFSKEGMEIKVLDMNVLNLYSNEKRRKIHTINSFISNNKCLRNFFSMDLLYVFEDCKIILKINFIYSKLGKKNGRICNLFVESAHIMADIDHELVRSILNKKGLQIGVVNGKPSIPDAVNHFLNCVNTIFRVSIVLYKKVEYVIHLFDN